MSDLKNVRVFVLAQGGAGPELFETTIVVSESDYNHGWHYELAQKEAKSAGFESPMMAFDEFDPAFAKFTRQDPTNKSLQDILVEADGMVARLVDSEEHATDAAVPGVAADASDLIRKLADIVAQVGKPALEAASLRRIAENVALQSFFSETPYDTIGEWRIEMAEIGGMPEGFVIAEAFEDLDEDALFEAVSSVADSIEGAMKQATSPEVIPSRVAVSYWDDQKPVEERPFFMEITDQRHINSQMYVDIAPVEGDIDDIMSITLEINRLPGDETDRQCAHLHFDGSNLAVSIFKDNGRYILRPETDVRISDVKLQNGELAWVIE